MLRSNVFGLLYRAVIYTNCYLFPIIILMFVADRKKQCICWPVWLHHSCSPTHRSYMLIKLCIHIHFNYDIDNMQWMAREASKIYRVLSTRLCLASDAAGRSGGRRSLPRAFSGTWPVRRTDSWLRCARSGEWSWGRGEMGDGRRRGALSFSAGLPLACLWINENNSP